MSVPEQYGKVPDVNSPTSAPTCGCLLPSNCPYVMASAVRAHADTSRRARAVFLSLNILWVSLKLNSDCLGSCNRMKGVRVGGTLNRRPVPPKDSVNCTG